MDLRNIIIETHTVPMWCRIRSNLVLLWIDKVNIYQI